MKTRVVKKSIVLGIIMLFVGAGVVPFSNANQELVDDPLHSTIWDGSVDTETILQQINTLKEYKRDFQVFYVFLDWTDGDHSIDNYTNTDSKGYYAFHTAPGTCNVSANAMIVNENETILPMNSTGEFLVDEQSSMVWKNITLIYPNHTATIIGHVYDNESKNPLAHAEVEIIYFGPQNTFYGFNSTFTNDTGYYELHLPPSTVIMFTAQAGYEPGGEPLFIIGEETQIHDFFLNPLPPPLAQYIKGHILDNTTHDPISHASVTIEDTTSFYFDSTSTNATGYYEFNVPVGNYTVTAMKDNYFTNATFVQIEKDDIRLVDINLDPFVFPDDNAWVEGYIYGNGQDPLENAEVTIDGSFSYYFTRYDFTRSTLSDQNGYYNVSVPAIPDNFPMQYSEIDSIDANVLGYFYNSTQYSYPDSIVEPGDVFKSDIYLDPMPEESCLIQGYITLIGWNITPPVNNPPFTPSTPNPFNGETNVPIDYDFSWTGGDPDQGDTVTYDIYFGTTPTPPKILPGNQSNTTYNPGSLNYLTTYYWRIIAWDNHNNFSIGQIWSFTTQQAPGNSAPIIYDEYPTNESTGVTRPPAELKVTISDLEGSMMDVDVKWKNHTGTWITLATSLGVSNGTYTFLPTGNDWVWGNTTYT
ncbi:MAG: carboxypeptidase regulatory-like domain-containing protein, partial [Thermoplasmata archaeon]|nr:carboxypeptidase regulatory-like domain-containing protein [Thermoplasmata archaeon]